MSVNANCPNCGAPITFSVGTSLVTVCKSCRSAVGRGDRGLESLGKVADLVETGSQLEVGVHGRFDGVPFTLTGRTQYTHPAGGVWDEWYASFADGKWGWLAEAQGRFYLTFDTPPPELPGFDDIALGGTIKTADGLSLVVAEKNEAAVAGMFGELPERNTPGAKHPFADLSGPNGEFGTLDYSGPAVKLYLGRQVTLDELGFPKNARRKYPGQEPTVQALSLACPKCGGPLELKAPDKSERVGCPYCGSLLDVREGNLKLLKSLSEPPATPSIPLGTTGQREGVTWTVIGFLVRSISAEGTRYPWEEYLLYQPRLGFRWLTCSEGHWNWVTALPPGAVKATDQSAEYAGRTYTLFQRAKARTDVVVGEFYWKVRADEMAASRDFVAAPYVLSEEVTKEGKTGEVNWSIGEYVEPDEVRAMFAMKAALPTRANIGPNQPYPHSGVYRVFGWLLAAAVLMAIFFHAISPRRTIYARAHTFKGDLAAPGKRSTTVIIEEPIRLRPRENLKVTLTPTSGTWDHINGRLAPAGESKPPRPVTRFAFVTPGAQSGWVYVGAPPPGDYTLSFELTSQNSLMDATADVKIEAGVSHPFLFGVVVLLLTAVPVGFGVYHLVWESRRWSESNTTGGED